MTPTTRSTIRIVGAVVAALMVLTAALSAMGQASRHTETTTHDLSAGLTSLEVVNDVGSVWVTAVEAGERPRAVVRSTGGFFEPSVGLSETGDTATLTGDCPSNIWFGPCDVEWEVFVPADVALSLESSVGDITVAGPAATVSAGVSVGQVNVSGATAEVLDLRSSVGDIVVDLAAPPTTLTATTSTGDVRVTVPDGATAYRVRSTTSVGTVSTTVPVDDASDHRLELLTSVGDVHVTTGS